MREKEIRIKIAKLEERKNHLISKIAVINDTILDLEALLESKSGLHSHESGLYVLQCHDLYKIGYASDLDYRVRDLQVSSPYDLRVIVFITCEVSQAARLEQSLHKRYHRKSVRGEWFRLTEKDLAEITSLKEAIPNGRALRYLSSLEEDDESEDAPIEKKIKKIIKSACNESRGPAIKDTVIDIAIKSGISKEEAEKVIDLFRRNGELFEPRSGYLRLP